jgi:MmyB-like transcription regulator ligand binding domain/Helix-turn-helix domain
VVVDNRNEIRQFLTSRRARITPGQAGLPVYGANRRVPGLRREEVALLAGVSVDYYTRLERGNLSGVSEGVLDALAQALQLDEAERGHLFDLARSANPTARPRRGAGKQGVRPSVQRIMDALDAPADVRNGRGDILAANRLGYALYSELPVRPANVARFLFLSPRAREFFPDWEGVANDLVASLRTVAGRNPHDRALQDLVGELSTRSQEFRTRWSSRTRSRRWSSSSAWSRSACSRLKTTRTRNPKPSNRDSTGLVTQSHRPRPELLAAYEPQLEPLAQAGEQRRPVARQDGLHDKLVLIDQPQIRQGQRELHASHEQAFAWLPLELLNGFPQVPPYELRVPIDPVQGARHDVLLCRVDRPGEGLHPLMPRSRRRRRPPRCLHHLVGHPAKEKGIGLVEVLDVVTMQLLVRDDHPVIAAAVEGDVDRVSERSHRRVAPPCCLNVTVTVETIVSERASDRLGAG